MLLVVGPGLEICIRVGLRKAQEIARTYQKPFVTGTRSLFMFDLSVFLLRS